MLYGRLLDNNSHRCESLADLSYPVVLLQGGESGGDRFIECLRGDLYGVLNVSNILYRNCARSQNHGKSVTYSPFVRHNRARNSVPARLLERHFGQQFRREIFKGAFCHCVINFGRIDGIRILSAHIKCVLRHSLVRHLKKRRGCRGKLELV